MGALTGVRVIEMAGIGPAPFTAMLLAEMGAEVIRVDRTTPDSGALAFDRTKEVTNRSRRSLALDLKSEEGIATLLELVDRADILIEGFRPGVMERLGVGPDVCHARNPRLVYGRMTGWGQTGPLADRAGHDINYIALTGALNAIGRAGQAPAVPLNLIGDFGGGGMMLAMGLLAAYISAQKTGEGQIVDAAMVDGANLLMTYFHGILQVGLHSDERGVNLLDGGAPFYDTYATKDGKWVAFGAIEAHFYHAFLRLAGVAEDDPVLNARTQYDRRAWPQVRARLQELFASKTRDEWTTLVQDRDVCVAPILTMTEAASHPHARAREAFVEVDGVVQPAPAPRFSRTPSSVTAPPPIPGEHSVDILRSWGVAEARIQELLAREAIAQNTRKR